MHEERAMPPTNTAEPLLKLGISDACRIEAAASSCFTALASSGGVKILWDVARKKNNGEATR